MVARIARVCCSTALAAPLLVAAPAASGAPYTVEHGPFHRVPRFAVRYSGSGSWRTLYHSEPPNDGGDHDTNDVDDSSTQRWQLLYRGALVVPSCRPARKRDDPCRRVGGLSQAVGPATVTGHVDHVHVDGLYREDDSQSHCDVSSSTPATRPLPARVDVSYGRRARSIDITVRNPVTSALDLLPGQCPSQGDSLDLLLDNYFTPGFSFKDGFGPDRWFTSRRISVPARVLRRATAVEIPLGDTPKGTPPPHCAVVHRDYERCTTGGVWAGQLDLTRWR